MKFQLTIECDNDAFIAFPDGEVARVLQNTAHLLYNPRHVPTRRDPLVLRDRNGNKVGEAYFTGRRPND